MTLPIILGLLAGCAALLANFTIPVAIIGGIDGVISASAEYRRIRSTESI